MSVSSAIRWVDVWRRTGRTAPYPRGGDRRSGRIEGAAAFLLAKVEETPDITLAELQALLKERDLSVGTGTVWRFFDRHGISFKKGSIRELYALVIECLERQEVGLWTARVSVWLSAARGLTRAQRREALAVLSGRSEGEASKAAIELGVDEARRCPHCSSEGAVSRGMARGLRRYQCKGCGRTFNALSGTPLSGLHHKERWLSFGASLAKGETVKASAARCDVAVSTAFRWRHRFLAAARSDSEVLKGIVEADETYVLESRKGARGLGRKARRRGGKAKKRGLSREQVPVLMAADRSGTTVSAVLPRVDAAALTAALDPVVAKDALLVSDGGASYPPCAAALGVSHEALNRSMGERVRGDLHVQTVNSRHSRLKDFLRPRRGIATRYLDNYLSWFHLVGLAPGANDRACLAAAVTR